MSLNKYVEKRKFDRTPEPAPSATEQAAHPLTFCVQRHHASHLHYDLRLEANGALKSWAVPKGPTLDPAEKRLAMMVEDHPLEYGGFEGVIPKGNYGAGSVMLWDRGNYELLGDGTADEQLVRGDFKFHLRGEKLSGDFALVKIKKSKGNEWLLLKKKDAFAKPGWDPEDHSRSVLTRRTQEEIARELPPPEAASKPHRNIEGAVKSPMPQNVSPMLAQIGKGTPPSSDDWLFEVKWDGVRAICYVDSGRLRMVSRNGHPMERQYPELSILPHHVDAGTAILDGEIAALDQRGLPSFEMLQRRINVAEAGAVATLARKDPVVFFAFDLLYLDGYDLRGVPLVERKRVLKEILKPGDLVRYSDHFAGNGAALFEASKAQGLEGIVGKRAASFYESRRTSDWCKWKITNSAEFVICGFTKGERDLFGALVLGVYDQGKLLWAGNVGTGFDRKMMETIHAKLLPLATSKAPLDPDKNLPKEVTWTRPEVVCEVKFSNWTDESRLRAPVFMGLRPDIEPRESVREEAPSRTELLAPDLKEATLTIDGQRLKFTHLDKLYYPDDGIPKRDLINYYDAVAPLLVPHLKDRPLSLRRYPDGIKAEAFFQKNTPESYPGWLRTETAPDGIRYIVADNRATLLYLSNLGCIDQNPWMSRVGSYESPDYVLIDLDPVECSYEKIVEAAVLVRKKLDLAELESYPKTTGGDGLHLYVPLEPRYTYEQVRSVAQLLAELAIAERPDLFTTPRAVSKRQKDRVYFDWAQIAEGKTISAPYVVRAYAGAPVATPLAWREVKPGLRPDQFTIRNAVARFDRVGDLFEPVLTKPQTLEHAIEKLAGAMRR
ncbi:MAG TPA: DNA ligase D [Bryobacteraceae bacterium]|nr:DNA ligase D [Bryobacteraceae bacterium]